MRSKDLVFGLLLLILGLGVWFVTTIFELGTANALVGVLAGVVLGLTRDRSPLARYGAFLIGLVFGLFALVLGMVGWIGWVGGIFVLTVISALTKGRLPLWAMILGGGTLAAVYQPLLLSSPWFVFTQYPTVLLVTLAASSGGFLVTIVVELLEDVTPGGSASAKAAGESADGNAIAGAPDTGLAPAAESSTVSGSE
ncbi:MAG: hypothetical protein V9E85_03665 [Candidatus Nanopelagicales bacterium]